MKTARRFLVECSTFDGHMCQHSAVTWMDEAKAIVVATYEHVRHHEELVPYRVTVESLGELDVDGEGVYVLRDDDVTDRMEW